MAGYRFTGKLDNNAPRQDEYTFYIAAMDNSGNYSEINEVTVQHPGIAQLPQPEVQRFFEAFVIEMPEVLTKFSKNQVYPDNSLIEEKDILGYVIRLDRVDTAQEGEKSFIEKKVPAGKSSEMIEVPAKSQWELTIGAYDSVYHPDYNSTLFENTFSEPLAISARQIDDIVDFVDELRPVEIVEELPTLPDDAHPEGSIIFYWEDRKLYKNDGNEWVSLVSAEELSGQITETQITDNSISTPKLQANAVTANEILAGTITANEIATNTITAGQIEAGAINTSELHSDAITADKISANEILAYHIQVDDLSAINANFSGTLQGADGLFSGVIEISDYNSTTGVTHNTILDGSGLKLDWDGNEVIALNGVPEAGINLVPTIELKQPGTDLGGVTLNPSITAFSYIPNLRTASLGVTGHFIIEQSSLFYQQDTEGYFEMGNFTIQWGESSANQTVSFPRSFHSQCFQVVAVQGVNNGRYQNVFITDITTSSFYLGLQGANYTCRWIAVGN